MYVRVQVEHSRNVFGSHNPEVQSVVQPVLTQPIRVLRGYRQSILLAAQQTVKLEFYFQQLAWFKSPETHLFNARVGPEHVHADPVANEYSHYRIIHLLVELRAHSDGHALAVLERSAGNAIAIQDFDVRYPARAVSMPEAGLGAGSRVATLRASAALAVQHVPDVPVHRVLGGRKSSRL